MLCALFGGLGSGVRDSHFIRFEYVIRSVEGLGGLAIAFVLFDVNKIY